MDLSRQSSVSTSPGGRPKLRVTISPSHVQQMPMLIPSPTSPIKSVSGTIFEGSHSTLFHAAQKERHSRLDQLLEDSEPPYKKPKSQPSSDDWLPAELTHPSHPATAVQRSSYESRSSDTDPSKFQGLLGLGITFGSESLDDSTVAAAQEKYEHTYTYDDSRGPDDPSLAGHSNVNYIGGADYPAAPVAAQMVELLSIPPSGAETNLTGYNPSRLDSASPSKLTIKGAESAQHDNSWSDISETDAGAVPSPFVVTPAAPIRNRNAFFMQDEQLGSHARKRRLSTEHTSTWRTGETLRQVNGFETSPTVTYISIGDDSPHFSFIPSHSAIPQPTSATSAPHESLSMLDSSPPIAAPATLKVNDYRTAALKRPRRRLSKPPPKPRASSAPVYSLMTTGRLPVTPKGTYESINPRVLSYVPTSAATSPTHSMIITEGINAALRTQTSNPSPLQSPPQLVLRLCVNQRRVSAVPASSHISIPISHVNSEKAEHIHPTRYDDEALCQVLFQEYRKNFCPSKWRYHCSARVLKRIGISPEASSASVSSPASQTINAAPFPHTNDEKTQPTAQSQALMQNFRRPARGRGKHVIIDWLKQSASMVQTQQSDTSPENTPRDQKEQWQAQQPDHPQCTITFIEGWAIARIAWAILLLALLSIMALVLWTVLGSTQNLFDTGTGWMQAGGRVGVGALLALLVLFLGGTGIAAWVTLSWMCA